MGIPDHLTWLLRNLYVGQEATVRTTHGTKDWFQIWKGVHQGCILFTCLFNLYAEYIMWNARIDESQAGINNLNNVVEKSMATHSSTLAWEIPWMKKPGRLAVQGVTMSWTRMTDFTFTFHYHALEKEMATLAWRIPGTAEPGGLPSMKSHRVGHDWSNLAAAVM